MHKTIKLFVAQIGLFGGGTYKTKDVVILLLFE